MAASTGGQISSRLLSLRSANVLLEIPQARFLTGPDVFVDSGLYSFDQFQEGQRASWPGLVSVSSAGVHSCWTANVLLEIPFSEVAAGDVTGLDSAQP